MKNIYLLLLFIFCSKGYAQGLDWFNHIGGSGEDVVMDINKDVNGNLLTVGFFSDSSSFESDSNIVTLESSGLYDVFVSKTDSDGNLIWAKSFGGSDYDYPTSVITDSNGNIFISGSFQGTADFDPGEDSYYLSSNVNYYDTFIIKLDTNGNFIWAKQIGGDDFEEVVKIKLDSEENLIAVGFFAGVEGDDGSIIPIDFDPNDGVFLLTSEGLRNTFVLKLNNDGDFIHAFRFGGNPELHVVTDFDIDSFNDIFITGFYDGVLDVNPSDIDAFNLTSVDSALYYAHFNSEGNLVNALTSAGDEYGRVGFAQIEVDNNSNVFINGYFEYAIEFTTLSGNVSMDAPTAFNGFVLKIDSFGNMVWAKHIQNTNGIIPMDIETDNQGNIYSTGFFSTNCDFDFSSEGTYIINQFSTNVTDAFLSILDSDGNFVSAYGLGGTNYIDTHKVLVDDNAIYLSGHFSNIVDVNPLDSETLNLNSNGDRDSYLIKSSPSALLNNEEFFYNNTLFVYPNPSAKMLYLENDNLLKNKSFKIYDITGKILENSNIKNGTIDIENLSEGTYFLKIENYKVIRFIKK